MSSTTSATETTSFPSKVSGSTFRPVPRIVLLKGASAPSTASGVAKVDTAFQKKQEEGLVPQFVPTGSMQGRLSTKRKADGEEPSNSSSSSSDATFKPKRREVSSPSPPPENESETLRSALNQRIMSVRQGPGGKEAILEAQAGMKSEESKVRSLALVLFCVLVEKGEGYVEALEAASSEIQREPRELFEEGLQLFEVLLKKEQGLGKALEIIPQWQRSSDPIVKAAANRLLQASSKQQRARAIANAANLMKSAIPTAYTQRAGLEAFSQCVQQGYGEQEATRAAEQGMKHSHNDVRKAALDLFLKLVGKEKGYPEALAAACVALEEDSLFDRALLLFEKLFAKGQGYGEAGELIAKWRKGGEPRLHQRAQELFLTLLKYPQSHSVLEERAKVWWIDDAPLLQESALFIFQALFNVQKGYDTAIEVACGAMSQTLGGTRALRLFEALFACGQGLAEALQSGQKNIKSSSEVIQLHAIGLLQKLVEKGYRLKTVREALLEGMGIKKEGAVFRTGDALLALIATKQTR